MPDFITVATFNTAEDANIIASWLDSEGIESIITGEHVTLLKGFYGNSINLQVNKKDADKAMQILKDGGYVNTSPDTSAAEDSEPNESLFKKYREPFFVLLFIVTVVVIVYFKYIYPTAY